MFHYRGATVSHIAIMQDEQQGVSPTSRPKELTNKYNYFGEKGVDVFENKMSFILFVRRWGEKRKI